MREIEFRGIIVGCEKEKEHYHKWIYGDLVRELSTGKTFILDVAHTSNGNATFNELAVEVFPETVSQFTGLLDKNGEKIFDGVNVLLHQFLFDGNEYDNQLIGQIIYDNEQACYCLTNIQQEQIQEYMGYKNDYTNFQKETVPIILFYGLHEESFEVIGNIHTKEEK